MKDVRSLIKDLRKSNVRLSLKGEHIQIEAADQLEEALLTQIRLNKEELLAYLKKNNSKTTFNHIIATPPQPHYPLSSAQRRLWTLSQLEEGNRAYNLPGVYVFEGELNKEALEHAFNSLVARHEILRTVFKEDEAQEIRQYILPAGGFHISWHDLSTEEHNHLKVKTLVQQAALTPFDLATGPLLRIDLYRLTDTAWVFSYVMHHIISDGWSMGILITELLHLYNDYMTGHPHPLPPLKIQYRDYAVWQQEQLKGDALERYRGYWLKQLDELPVLQLTGDYARPALKTYNGGVVRAVMDKTLSGQIKTLIQEQECTLFMGLLAIVNVLLYRYTGQEDMVTGTPVAGREHIDLEDQIGFYVNTLALRTRLNGDEGYTALLAHVKKITAAAYEHQVYPFDELMGVLPARWDKSRNPVFDVVVVLQNNTSVEKDRHTLNGLKISPYTWEEVRSSKFDYTFTFAESGEEILINVEYNSDIYSKEMAEQMVVHLKQLTAAIAKQPLTPLKQLLYLNNEEQQELLTILDNTSIDYPKEKTIISLFEEQVSRTPGNIAITYEGEHITYRELNERANRLGHYLRSHYEVKADDLIGIQLERSEWMLIAILGVLKSGGAYVPVDPAYPADRIQFMLTDSQCKVLIDEEELSRFLNEESSYASGNLASINGPGDLAYVIYTSGTTGRPKGTLIEQRNVVRLFFTDAPLFDFNASDTWTLFHSYCFDFSVWEIFGALLFGGRLVVVPVMTAKDAESFLHLLRNEDVTVLNQTPSSFYNLIREETSGLALRYVIFGGEALSPGRLKEWKSRYPATRLINMYGITETTVHVTYKEITDEAIARNISNIGRPIPGLRCYVLDGQGQLLPFGVPGELYVGGDGVARGYLNREQLTEERFIADPFRTEERLYRSGDEVRLLSSGELEYIGRKDNQLKIRGYRIELGEIERTLQGYGGLEAGLVIGRTNADGEKELIAYMVSDTPLNASTIRSYMGKTLPDYMVPAHYVQLEAFPLTSNGKIDYHRLPSPLSSAMATGVVYQAPTTETEKQLALIWQELLEKERVSVKDDFFASGGNSLKATRLSSQIYKTFGVKLSLRDLFFKVTLEEQAVLITEADKASFITIPVADVQSAYPLSSPQRRLWVLSQFKESNVAYNMTGVYLFEGKLDSNAFVHSFAYLLERHEILRTIFREDAAGEIRQIILSGREAGFLKVYEQEPRNSIEALIVQDAKTPFDLTKGPLLRARLYYAGDNNWVFSYVMHHIISDGWSMNILFNELLHCYNAFKKGELPALRPLRIQYKDYAVWQQAQLNTAAFEAHKNYWLNEFSGKLPVLELPVDKPRPVIKTYNGDVVYQTIDATHSKAINTLAREQEATLFMGLLSLVNILLYRYTGQEDMIIGSSIAGRDHIDLEDQIGFYINTPALRVRFSGDDTYQQLLAIVKQVTLGAYEHQAYPFDDLIEVLQPERDISRSPLFDVMVVLQDAGDGQGRRTITPEGLIVKHAEQAVSKISKFDLIFMFAEIGEEIQFSIQYNSDIYKKQTIEKLAAHLLQLIQAVTINPQQPVRKLDYLTTIEKQRLLTVFNNPAYQVPQQTITDLFEAQVEKTPDSIALIFEQKIISYRELNNISNQFAHYLKAHHHIQAGDLIGIKLDRSEGLIIAILGILKAGAAYVPFDSAYPGERIRYMIVDSNCKVIVDTALLEQFNNAQDDYSRETPAAANTPDSLAYVMYTSGSTGEPKGVMIEHKSVVRLVHATNFVHLRAEDVLLSTGAVSFDATTFEYWSMLLNGGCLIMCRKEVLLDTDRLAACIREHKVTMMWFTAGWLNELVDKDISIFGGLKTLLAGGDKLSVVHINRLLAHYPHLEIINGYGPTENTTFSLTYKIRSAVDTIPVGRPINGSTAYILDNSLQLCPPGVTGEICVGGAGLARGYRHRADLTEAQFISHPYITGERLYRTGDLGKWLPDGNIAFLGRKDDQVKIRGYRIELGEIESVLQRHEAIDAAVVLCWTDTNGEKELSAYFVSNTALQVTQVRTYLGQQLPDHMIPAHYVQLVSLPLTANGKVDRKQLLRPETVLLNTDDTYVAPRNETEEKLVLIWQDILGRDKIGVTDNFFEAGGHSLKASRLISQVNRKFDIDLGLLVLFSHPTIEGMANEIEKIYWAGNKLFEIDNAEKISI